MNLNMIVYEVFAFEMHMFKISYVSAFTLAFTLLIGKMATIV